MKKLLNYFTKFEIGLWNSSVLIIIATFFIFEEKDYLTLIASLIGATFLILNAKGNPLGQFLTIVFSLLYGIISYRFDYYGEMLTERQRMCLDLRYNQDLSLAEIAEELGVSRQGVHDNIIRAEAHLQKMEAKTGCVGRDLNCRKAARTILDAAQKLRSSDGASVSTLAQTILDAARELEE